MAEAVSPPPVSPTESLNEAERHEESERELLKTFINLYRANPILWNTSLKEYSDRDKKNKCYGQLLTIYRKIKKDAKIEDVKKKINSLRTNFRKELKKIKDSQRTGSSADNIYEPSSWVFWELQFLKDVETPDSSISTMQETNTVASECMPEEGVPLAKKTKHPQKISQDTQLLSLACNYLSKEDKHEDEYFIAQVWAKKLKVLEPKQKLFAEKAINDILFEASLGTLNRDSVKINCTNSNPSTRPTSAQSWAPSCTSYSTVYPLVSTPMQSPQYQHLQESERQPQLNNTSESTQPTIQNYYNAFQT